MTLQLVALYQELCFAEVHQLSHSGSTMALEEHMTGTLAKLYIVETTASNVACQPNVHHHYILRIVNKRLRFFLHTDLMTAQ